MLKIELHIDEIDYESAISLIFPLIIKNKIKCKAAMLSATNKLKGKTPAEKNAVFSDFICEHKEQIINKAKQKAELFGISINISDIISNAK